VADHADWSLDLGNSSFEIRQSIDFEVRPMIICDQSHPVLLQITSEADATHCMVTDATGDSFIYLNS